MSLIWLSYPLIKFLPGACFKQRNETKQQKQNKKNVIDDNCEVNKFWGGGGWGEKREFSF